MASQTRVSQKAGAATAAKLKHSRSLNAQLGTLLLECPTRHALFEQVLQIARKQFSASVGRIAWMEGDTAETRLIHDDRIARNLAARFDQDYLEPLCTEVLDSSEPEPKLRQYKRGDQQMTLIAAPIVDVASGRIAAALTLMTGAGHPSPETILPALDGVAAMASTVLAVKSGVVSRQQAPAGESTGKVASERPQDADQRRTLMENQALQRVSQFSSTREFGYSIVNSLCGQLQAEQVFFGVAANKRIVVEAVSGIADFKASSPGIAVVRQAMEECLDRGSSIVAPPPLQSDMTAGAIHRRWSDEHGHACVCSIPLKQDDEITAIISIRRPSSKPFQAEELQKLERSLEPYGAATRVVAKANRSVAAQLRESISDSARRQLARGTIGRKVLLGALLLAVGWFFFGSITYRPICRTQVTAAQLRHFAAPFDGRLSAVPVRPGQVVRAGDVLAEFDTAAFRLELNGLERQITASQVELRQAIAVDEMSQAALVRSQLNVLQVQAAAVRRRIQDARLVAPADGTVILSDLEQRIGQIFAQGEEILQFAPEGGWLLEIEVPDDIVSYVASEQTGTFAAASLPTDPQTFKIQHIDGAAMVVEDRNVFIARAPLKSRPEWMKTGMQGTARLETVPRPVWWVAMHRVVDWARTSFWI